MYAWQVREAEERGIFIVKECFIDACIAAKKLIVLHGYESQYLFNPTAPKPQKNTAAAAARRFDSSRICCLFAQSADFLLDLTCFVLICIVSFLMRVLLIKRQFNGAGKS